MESARKKIADALLNQKAINIQIRQNIQTEEKMEEKIIACNNNKCIKKDECKRYELFKNGAKEYTTNGGTKEKGCGKFIKK